MVYSYIHINTYVWTHQRNQCIHELCPVYIKCVTHIWIMFYIYELCPIYINWTLITLMRSYMSSHRTLTYTQYPHPHTHTRDSLCDCDMYGVWVYVGHWCAYKKHTRTRTHGTVHVGVMHEVWKLRYDFICDIDVHTINTHTHTHAHTHTRDCWCDCDMYGVWRHKYDFIWDIDVHTIYTHAHAHTGQLMWLWYV